MTSQQIVADKTRVPALEKQLIMCELRGEPIKARLLRGALRAIKIRQQVHYAQTQCNEQS